MEAPAQIEADSTVEGDVTEQTEQSGTGLCIYLGSDCLC